MNTILNLIIINKRCLDFYIELEILSKIPTSIRVTTIDVPP